MEAFFDFRVISPVQVEQKRDYVSNEATTAGQP
jgi:hypothetical protein